MRVLRGSVIPIALLLIASLAAAQPQAARDYVYGPGGRLAATIEPDMYPPDGPADLYATPLTCMQVELSWPEATDIGSGVAGYEIYRDGWSVGSTSDLSYTDDTGNTFGGFYSYEVKAYDQVGHEAWLGGTAEVELEECNPWGGGGGPWSFWRPSGGCLYAQPRTTDEVELVGARWVGLDRRRQLVLPPRVPASVPGGGQ